MGGAASTQPAEKLLGAVAAGPSAAELGLLSLASHSASSNLGAAVQMFHDPVLGTNSWVPFQIMEAGFFRDPQGRVNSGGQNRAPGQLPQDQSGNGNSGSSQTSSGGAPQNPRYFDIPREDYRSMGLVLLRNALVNLLHRMRNARISSTPLTDRERFYFLAEFLGIVEQLIDCFNVRFSWDGDMIQANILEERITFDNIDSEMFYLDSLLQSRNTGGAAAYSTNVIYGFRCVLCDPRQYRYVGLTSNSLVTRAAAHLARIRSRSRSTANEESNSPRPTRRMPMADHAIEHVAEHTGLEFDDVYVVDVLRCVQSTNLRSWEVIYQWLLRTRIRNGGFNIR